MMPGRSLPSPPDNYQVHSPTSPVAPMMMDRTLPTPSNGQSWPPYSPYSAQHTSPPAVHTAPERPYSVMSPQSMAPQVLSVYYSAVSPQQLAPTGVRVPNRKGPWGPQEDRELTELVRYELHKQACRNGYTSPRQSSDKDTIHWGEIAQRMRFTRTAKQCRERWTQNLHPDLKHTAITEDEGKIILDLVQQKGKKWAEIARDPRLRGRSDNHIKNWWNGWNNGQRSGSDRQRARRQIRSQHAREAPRPYVGQQPLPHMITPPSSEPSVSPSPRYENSPTEAYPSHSYQPVSPAEPSPTYPYPTLPPVSSLYQGSAQYYTSPAVQTPVVGPVPVEPTISPQQRPQPRLSFNEGSHRSSHDHANKHFDERRRSNDPFFKVALNL